MTIEELGRGLGWMGGVVYLLALAEQQVRRFLMQRKIERETEEYERRRALEPPPAPPPPLTNRVHVVPCIHCGQNVVAAIPYDCPSEHAPAPPPFAVGRRARTMRR